MKSILKILPIACLLLMGCLRPMTSGVINRDYGSPPPVNHQEMIKENFAQDIFNPPASAIYTFDAPLQTRIKSTRWGNVREKSGWIVCGTIDSRHGKGGYSKHTGPVPFFVIFKNGIITDKLAGYPTDPNYSTDHRITAVVTEACHAARLSSSTH